jgi:ribosomal protein S18 acetylase RimI-like enzyme
MITIRRITAQDTALYREVRLRALLDSPLAFGSTYAKESAFADSVWRERIERASASNDIAMFLAFEDHNCCGIIGCVRRADEEHTGTIVSMWVAPEVRRKGVGRRLLESAEQWARENRMIRLMLDVTEKNDPAIALYRACGFDFTGESQPYPNDPILRELFMMKPLQ